MRKIRMIALTAAALLTVAASVPAQAHGGHHHGHSRVSVGVAFGGPWYWGYPGYYYPPPYYYYPRVVTARAEPVTYIERGDVQAQAEEPQGYWYYCPEAKAYHPYVKHCAGAWQRVPARPTEIR